MKNGFFCWTKWMDEFLTKFFDKYSANDVIICHGLIWFDIECDAFRNFFRNINNMQGIRFCLWFCFGKYWMTPNNADQFSSYLPNLKNVMGFVCDVRWMCSFIRARVACVQSAAFQRVCRLRIEFEKSRERASRRKYI